MKPLADHGKVEYNNININLEWWAHRNKEKVYWNSKNSWIEILEYKVRSLKVRINSICFLFMKKMIAYCK